MRRRVGDKYENELDSYLRKDHLPLHIAQTGAGGDGGAAEGDRRDGRTAGRGGVPSLE